MHLSADSLVFAGFLRVLLLHSNNFVVEVREFRIPVLQMLVFFSQLLSPGDVNGDHGFNGILVGFRHDRLDSGVG